MSQAAKKMATTTTITHESNFLGGNFLEKI
jgi:hypothetical protein